jgi:hypothetical protein
MRSLDGGSDDDRGQWHQELRAIWERRTQGPRRYGPNKFDGPSNVGDGDSSGGATQSMPPTALEPRNQELLKLDALEDFLFDELSRHRNSSAGADASIQQSRGAARRGGDTGLAIVDRLLRVAERRAKLDGIDAPRRREAEVITDEAVQKEIARLDARFRSMCEMG